MDFRCETRMQICTRITSFAPIRQINKSRLARGPLCAIRRGRMGEIIMVDDVNVCQTHFKIHFSKLGKRMKLARKTVKKKIMKRTHASQAANNFGWLRKTMGFSAGREIAKNEK